MVSQLISVTVSLPALVQLPSRDKSKCDIRIKALISVFDLPR